MSSMRYNSIATSFNFDSTIFMDFSNFCYDSYWNSLASYLYIPTLNLVDNNSSLFTSLDVLIISISSNILILSLVFLASICYGMHGISMLNYSLNSTTAFSTLFESLGKLEDDIGSLDDVLFYSVLICIIFGWFLLFFIFSPLMHSSFKGVLIILNFTLVTVFVLPSFLLYSFGISFPQFVRGSGTTSSLFFEFYSDVLSLVTMLSRFCIQNFRLLIIFVAFHDLAEFIYCSYDVKFSSFISQMFSFDSSNCKFFLNNCWYDWLSDVFSTHLLLFFYTGHLVYTFLNQACNYLFLSIMLFLILYSGFAEENFEEYFYHKRLHS